MQISTRSSNDLAFRPRESGQASVLLLLMLSTFLIAIMAFAVDLTGMFFHRQAVQTATDAACLVCCPRNTIT